MKELEKTKRISISAILFILVILIGILSFKRPKNVFNKDNYLALNHIIKQDYILNKSALDSISTNNFTLIDVRSAFEFNKGHLDNAINIYTSDFLDDNQKSILKKLEKQDKMIVLYASNPDEANGSWFFLTQLGFKNIKLLCVNISYKDNKIIIADYPLEKAQLNYADFMNKTISDSTINNKKIIKKQVLLTQKKKKTTQGGC